MYTDIKEVTVLLLSMFPYIIRLTPILFFVLLFFTVSHSAFAAEVVRPIAFPVNGAYSYRNDFHEPRGNGTRLHIGNDIIAVKMTPLVSVVDGYVNYLAIPQQSWGYEISIQDADGYSYDYLHVNNDTPGTDDGKGGEVNAYAPGIAHGVRVTKGQLIGWVGDSGNAETTLPHLHFEMRDPSHTVINPYASLYAASGGAGVSESAPRTNVDEVSLEQRKVELRYIFTKELSVGSESSEVRQLQLVLKAFQHFTTASPTGYFGPVTEAAVKSYQRAKKLRETGKVGAETRELLNNDLGTYDPNLYKPYYTDAEVRAVLIQKLLQQIAVLQARLRAIQGF